jgi:hypothetical protein
MWWRPIITYTGNADFSRDYKLSLLWIEKEMKKAYSVIQKDGLNFVRIDVRN